MNSFVSAEWVKQRLGSEDLIIFDARQDLTGEVEPYDIYREKHIESAFFLDGENELVGEKIGKHGGRHPLPNLETFAEIMRSFGLSNSKIVVAYGFNAGRVLYLLKLIGFNRVFILNGGFEEWERCGYPTTDEIKTPVRGNFTPNFDKSSIVDRDFVFKNYRNENILLVDSRSEPRYRGEIEPIDPVAGHIPRAVNYDFMSNFDENGKLKSRELIKSQFDKVLDYNKEIILYCGSGVTATYNYILLSELGINVKIYAGSWSDWISYEGSPVSVGSFE